MKIDKYKTSNQLLEEAKQVTPLGAQTYSKSYRYFTEGEAPLYIERGKGNKVWDVDGNQFIDFIAALGPITIGYSDERVNSAIREQLDKGIVFSQPASISVVLAKKLVEIIPCAEMVRFVKNGSDATTAAVKLARAYTDREMVLACGYHGMQDWYIGASENNKGVPKSVGKMTKMFMYNDKDSVRTLLKEYGNNVAAIILEPFQQNGPEDDFLEFLKEEASAYGCVLIFDEVKSGFWFALGGYSEVSNVTPDMATFGKGMANGMPISVVAGKREIVELIETEKVFVSTTFGGEALSMAAALETINILEQEGTYEHIWKTGAKLMEGFQNLVEKFGFEEFIHVKGAAPYCGLEFNDYNGFYYLNLLSVYQHRMIEEGILTLGMNHINLAHSEEDVEKFISATKKAFEDIESYINSDVEKEYDYKWINHVFQRNR